MHYLNLIVTETIRTRFMAVSTCCAFGTAKITPPYTAYSIVKHLACLCDTHF